MEFEKSPRPTLTIGLAARAKVNRPQFSLGHPDPKVCSVQSQFRKALHCSKHTSNDHIKIQHLPLLSNCAHVRKSPEHIQTQHSHPPQPLPTNPPTVPYPATFPPPPNHPTQRETTNSALEWMSCPMPKEVVQVATGYK
jgi:hypothetical protein